MDDRLLIKRIGTKKLMDIFELTKGAISYWRRHGIPHVHKKYLEVAYPKYFRDVEPSSKRVTKQPRKEKP